MVDLSRELRNIADAIPPVTAEEAARRADARGRRHRTVLAVGVVAIAAGGLVAAAGAGGGDGSRDATVASAGDPRHDSDGQSTSDERQRSDGQQTPLFAESEEEVPGVEMDVRAAQVGPEQETTLAFQILNGSGRPVGLETVYVLEQATGTEWRPRYTLSASPGGAVEYAAAGEEFHATAELIGLADGGTLSFDVNLPGLRRGNYRLIGTVIDESAGQKGVVIGRFTAS
jgi:hypothetical protein